MKGSGGHRASDAFARQSLALRDIAGRVDEAGHPERHVPEAHGAGQGGGGA